MGLDLAIRDVASPLLRGAMGCALLAFLTRGLHLDGLADTADGLLSARPTDEALAIMKDSATGALGALTLSVILILKTAAISDIVQDGHTRDALLLVPVCSRLSLVVLASLSEYARREGGLGQYFVGKNARGHLSVAMAVSLGVSMVVAGLKGVVLVTIASLIGLMSARWFKRRLGGVTGDCLGAHLETSETLLFIVAALSA